MTNHCKEDASERYEPRAERQNLQTAPNLLVSMTIQDLHRNYTKDELSAFPGDRKLRYRAFAPLFSDLHEQKIVYYERFLHVVELRDIELAEEGFCATAVPVVPIETPFDPEPRASEQAWVFRGSWDWMRLVSHSINVPYAGWRVWPGRERVKRVEALVVSGRVDEALELTLYETEIETETETDVTGERAEPAGEGASDACAENHN